MEGGWQGAEGVHPETFGVVVDLFCESMVYIQSKRDGHHLLLHLWMESLVYLAVAGIPYAINGLYTMPVEVFALTLSITQPCSRSAPQILVQMSLVWSLKSTPEQCIGAS